jgi:penicillin-insensitive murein DD-endopeptidase
VFGVIVRPPTKFGLPAGAPRLLSTLAAFVLALSPVGPARSAPAEAELDGQAGQAGQAGQQGDDGEAAGGPGTPPDEASVPGPAGQAPAGSGIPRPSLRARANAFSRFRGPLAGRPAAIGSYTNGCLVGGVALPPSGTGFEVIRLGRNRHFGHPALVSFIKRLGASAKRQKIGPLIVGDVAQPRGGPTPSGHRSHQSGLDVDVGFTAPSWLAERPVKAPERELLSLVPVVDLGTRTFTSEWSPKVEQLIELAASDPDVERVFVNPRIKRELCERAATGKALLAAMDRGRVVRPRPVAGTRKYGRWLASATTRSALQDRKWLRTVRPWRGHHDHMHIRLKCPADSTGCEAQAPLPPGDGCNELAWWEIEEARRAREPRRVSPPPLDPPPAPPVPPPLPPACQALLQKIPVERSGGLQPTAARQVGSGSSPARRLQPGLNDTQRGR